MQFFDVLTPDVTSGCFDAVGAFLTALAGWLAWRVARLQSASSRISSPATVALKKMAT